MAQAQAVESVSNNLANQATKGFKRDDPTFKEYLSLYEREHPNLDIPRAPIKDKDFYPINGRDQSFVVVDGTYTNFKQGSLDVTQAPLDLALDGPGFFEVHTPSGVRYTRQGSFKVAMDGRLVTSEGYPVLSAQPGGLATALPGVAVQPGQGWPSTQGGVVAGQPQPDVTARYINLRDLGPNLTISEKGEIYSGDQPVADLSVVEFQDRNQLRKQGGLLFENTNPANRTPAVVQTRVRQGMLEGSNVNPAEEMTKLIQAHRMYESNLKAMKTTDEMMAKEVNELGKL